MVGLVISNAVDHFCCRRSAIVWGNDFKTNVSCISPTNMTLFNVPDYLDWPAQFCLLTTVVTWLASVVTSNVSQVDRLWTFLPTIYTAYYALLPLLPNSQPYPFVPYAPKALGWHTVRDYSPRALLMLTLITIWMFRCVSFILWSMTA